MPVWRCSSTPSGKCQHSTKGRAQRHQHQHLHKPTRFQTTRTPPTPSAHAEALCTGDMCVHDMCPRDMYVPVRCDMCACAICRCDMCLRVRDMCVCDMRCAPLQARESATHSAAALSAVPVRPGGAPHLGRRVHASAQLANAARAAAAAAWAILKQKHNEM